MMKNVNSNVMVYILLKFCSTLFFLNNNWPCFLNYITIIWSKDQNYEERTAATTMIRGFFFIYFFIFVNNEKHNFLYETK